MDADYNLKYLVEAVKDDLQDESYDENLIIRYINESYFEIFGELPHRMFEKIYSYETIDSGELEVPKDFQTMKELIVERDKMKMPLKYVEPEKYFAEYEGMKVYSYTVFGNVVHYHLPIEFNCDQNDDNPDNYYTLKMYYIAKPVKLQNDTDVPLIPSEYGELLIEGAKVRAERRRGNYDFAQIYDNHKAELITNMSLRYGPRQMGGGSRIETPFNIRINEV